MTILLTKDASGAIYGYDDNPASQALAQTRITAGHVAYMPPAPTAAQLLAQAQATQIGVVTAAYQAAAAAPVSFTTASGLAKTFQADAQSVANLSGSLLSFTASTLPSGFYWVASDNTQVPVTYADLKGLAAAMALSSWTAFQRLQGAKAAINSATTTAAVQAVVF